MTEKADSLAIRSDGRVTLTLGGKTLPMRRPTIGEQWKFDDAFVALQQAEQDDAQWATELLGDVINDDESVTSNRAVLAAIRKIKPDEANERLHARQAMLLDWWELVFHTLGPDDFDWPPKEDLPPFLLDFKQVNLIRSGWAENPADPGDD